MDTVQKFAKLIIDENTTIELPIVEGTAGPKAIDIGELYNKTKFITYDPGFASTGSCASAITYIDGEKGILLYRGYPIEKLAEKCDFWDVAYLLTKGELPDESQKNGYIRQINQHTLLHEQVRSFFSGFRRDAHPMSIMVGVVGALSAFYHDSLDINDPVQRELASIRLIAKTPTIAAMAYKYALGQPFNYPLNALSFGENFLHMMFSLPAAKNIVNPVLSQALDRVMILHADHEQNASTSTVRIAGSSGANPFACIAAGVASLWGPAHGGANEAVLNMLKQIGSKDKIPEYIAKAKDKDDPFRLMGFGHRIYKNYDPRAKVMQQTCYQVLDVTEHRSSPLLELAMELERIALQDEYFVERKLYPNVDFYSGIIFEAMGIPPSMFTVLFAVARTVGWVAQWNEMISEPKLRISRPRQVYIGQTERDFETKG